MSTTSGVFVQQLAAKDMLIKEVKCYFEWPLCNNKNINTDKEMDTEIS